MFTPNLKSAQPTATLQKYRSIQIGLHWATVLLVVFQFLTADAMGKFFDAAEDAGRLAGFPDEPVAMAHALEGGLILIFTAARLLARIAYGAPDAPASLPTLLKVISRATHYGLYLLLILVPVSGAVALYVTPDAGDIHKILKTLLLVTVGLHVAGAAYHALALRDETVRRMLPSSRT